MIEATKRGVGKSGVLAVRGKKPLANAKAGGAQIALPWRPAPIPYAFDQRDLHGAPPLPPEEEEEEEVADVTDWAANTANSLLLGSESGEAPLLSPVAPSPRHRHAPRLTPRGTPRKTPRLAMTLSSNKHALIAGAPCPEPPPRPSPPSRRRTSHAGVVLRPIHQPVAVPMKEWAAAMAGTQGMGSTPSAAMASASGLSPRSPRAFDAPRYLERFREQERLRTRPATVAELHRPSPRPAKGFSTPLTARRPRTRHRSIDLGGAEEGAPAAPKF